MKKKLFLTATLCAFGISILFAQTNLDMESWTSTNPNGWSTTNEIIPYGSPQTIFQETTNPGEGLSSAKITTVSWPGGAPYGLDPLGGLISLGGSTMLGTPLGMSYTQKPTSFDFTYKANPMSGDTGVVFFQLSYWDGAQRAVIAQAYLLVDAPVSTWTPVNMPINYYDTITTPDTLMLVALSSMGMLFGSPTLIVGSELYVDAFVLNFGASPLSATATSTNATCNGDCNGTATVVTLDGTPPYTYSWNTSPVQNTATATGLCAGSYTVTVTDAAAGSTTASANIGEPAAVTLTMNSTNESTSGACDGTASVTASGMGPYTYLWSPGGQTTATATNLCAGSYTVTVYYNGSCSVTGSVTVNSGGCAITASITSSTDETAPGANDGTATVTASNGTLPYTYLWSDGQTTSTATGLAPGPYTITVTDAAACAQTASVTINAASGCTLTVSVTSTDETGVGADDGTATATPANGTAPYTYLWSDGQTTSTATGLAPSSYTVTVTDAEPCTATGSVVINAFVCTLTGTMSGMDESSVGAGDGTATVAASGGTTPYTYLWSDGQTTSTATSLGVGIYSVTVTDANGCAFVGSQAVNSPGCTLTATVSGTDETAAGANNGTASVTASGGTTPYNYMWNTSDTTNTISGLTPGPYTVTVTDAAGCLAAGTYNVAEGAIVGIQQPAVDLTQIISVYPNPANHFINFKISGYKEGAMIYIFDIVGKQIMNASINGEITSVSIAELSRGMYIYKIVNEKGITLKGGKFSVHK
ncbi:MAG: T9SS type A sorting domain-containing protein [Bacteroidota bacterium]